ncbi:hypothetical protein TIFTF001_019343 [Ficus carica]|uniref:Uncharacterized protein n=1 Tax=Ficus carica TaxID=3494 RepID=A0AA88A6B5_FICCA|nr:hypothetical protein TIFTF001_019343 [Ficus carica]
MVIRSISSIVESVETIHGRIVVPLDLAQGDLGSSASCLAVVGGSLRGIGCTVVRTSRPRGDGHCGLARRRRGRRVVVGKLHTTVSSSLETGGCRRLHGWDLQ